MNIRLSLVAALGGLFSCSPVEKGQPEVVLPLRVDLEKRTLRDAEGRAILLRGFNYSGLEFGNFIENAHGPSESDFVQMKSWGANVIRLAFAWRYLQPKINEWDETYLEAQMDRVIEWAGQNGMFVIPEAHQYFWSPCTGGIGAPAWVCDGYDYSAASFPYYEAQTDFWEGKPAQDGKTLQEHYLDMWKRVVLRYKNSPYVIGFNYMNEPMDLAGADTFQAERLYPEYRKWAAMVRDTGANQLLVLDPMVTRNLGAKMSPEPVGDDNVLYAPHLYTNTGGLPGLAYLGNVADVKADYGQAQEEARIGQALLWVGEYGGVNQPEFLPKTALLYQHSIAEQNLRRLGGAAWAYFPGGNEFSVVTKEGEEYAGLIDAFSTPYPKMTAGKAKSIEFDAETKVFTFRFMEEGADVPDPTVVYVPKARHYPNGISVTVSEGDRAEWDEAQSAFLIYRDTRLAEHELILKPGN